MSTLDAAELKRQVIERAGLDEGFRQALLKDPLVAIKRMAGDSLPEGFTFNPATDLGALAQLKDIDPDDLGLGRGKM